VRPNPKELAVPHLAFSEVVYRFPYRLDGLNAPVLLQVRHRVLAAEIGDPETSRRLNEMADEI
jgi:hypothetical protein